MEAYALIAYLLVGGAIRAEVVDYGLSLEECETMSQTIDQSFLTFPSDADHVPLACEVEYYS